MNKRKKQLKNWNKFKMNCYQQSKNKKRILNYCKKAKNSFTPLIDLIVKILINWLKHILKMIRNGTMQNY